MYKFSYYKEQEPPAFQVLVVKVVDERALEQRGETKPMEVEFGACIEPSDRYQWMGQGNDQEAGAEEGQNGKQPGNDKGRDYAPSQRDKRRRNG
jgi:hypothetical protein